MYKVGKGDAETLAGARFSRTATTMSNKSSRLGTPGAARGKKTPGGTGSFGASRTRSSVEAEQRTVVVTATQALLDIRNFRTRYKLDHVDHQRISILAVELLRHSGLSEVECRTRQDFQEILNEKKNDLSWKKKFEAEIMELICDRAGRFETLVPQMQQRLRSCYDDLVVKNFQSYSSELDPNMELKAVIDYDKKIKEYRHKVETQFEQLDSFYAEYDKMKEPFVLSYLGYGGKVTSLLEQCLVLIIDICELFKKWSNQDKSYPKKLWDETIGVNVQRGKVMEDIKKLQRKKYDLVHTLGRKEAQRDRLIQKLEETKRERSMMEAKVEDSKTVLVEMEKNYEKTCEELELTERKITNRKSNSPKYFETLWNSAENLKVLISKLGDMKDGQVRQVNRFMKSLQDLTTTTEQLEKETKAQINQVETLETRIDEVNGEISKANEELKTLEVKAATSKYIRDLKVAAPTAVPKRSKHNDTTEHKLRENCQDSSLFPSDQPQD